MSRPKILDKPTAVMLAAVKDQGTVKCISAMVNDCRENGFFTADYAMHIEIGTRIKEPKSGGPPAIFYNGMRIAPMPYDGFRRIHATDDPIIHKLMAMQGKVPNDLVLVVTESHTAYHGWAMLDFDLDPLAVMGAL